MAKGQEHYAALSTLSLGKIEEWLPSELMTVPVEAGAQHW